MRKENEQIIKEFLKSTPAWLDSMKAMEEHSNFKLCPYCGVNYVKIKALAEAVEDLFTPLSTNSPSLVEEK